MRNKIFAILVGVPMIVSSTQAISQPVTTPETDRKNVTNLTKVVETQNLSEVPTKDEIAKTQIAQRQAELAKQAEALNLQKQEEQKKLEEAAQATKVATQKVATQVVSYNIEQWRPIVAKYPWPVEEAMLTMTRESGGNPRAVSATDDHGLFQIHNGLTNYGPAIYDPETNVQIAYKMYAARGWRPWYAVRGILW